jgi:alpha-1,3-glucan synthase
MTLSAINFAMEETSEGSWTASTISRGWALRYGISEVFMEDKADGPQGLYIVGMPHINLPWSYDGFSPVDLTLLDHHFGNIQDWRDMISEAHRRGMYVVLENTFATMGDLLGFEGFLNTSTPFNPKEHNYVWKDTRRYLDFAPGNDYIEKCDYPRFWGAGGERVTNTTNLLVGCRDSEFDQVGTINSINYENLLTDITVWRGPCLWQFP